MVKPIPDNVKATLNELTSAQQVILRSYIASLRSDIVSLEEEALNRTVGADSHAHYHGHELCTADHGHGEHEKDDDHHEHKHTEHCDHKDHDRKNHDHHDDKDHHEHKHTEHCEHDHEHHEHKDHDHEHHEHKHHDHHEHKHHHDEAHSTATAASKEEDIPAWKKAALSSDPSAAPFGGNWHSESNVSASESGKSKTDSMEE
jgi:hypothetical protein